MLKLITSENVEVKFKRAFFSAESHSVIMRYPDETEDIVLRLSESELKDFVYMLQH